MEDLRKKMTVAKYTTLANHIIDSQAGGETSDEAAAAVGNDIVILALISSILGEFNHTFGFF